MDDNGGSGAGVEEDEEIDDDNYENYEESNYTDNYEYEEVNETEIEIKKTETKSVTEKDVNNIENNNKNIFTLKPKKTLTVGQRHKKMTEALCDVLSDFGLVSFLPMNVQDGEVRTIFISSKFFFFILPLLTFVIFSIFFYS